MRLTARQLNRATLARQLLLRREAVDVVEAVRRVVALQAQEPASPYVALWDRVEGFDPAQLDAAFASQAIIKAQLMRITLHAVTAADYPAFHEAMRLTLRAARLHDRRFTNEGVSIPDAEALVPDLLEHTSSPRVNREVEAWLEARFGAPKPRVWWALRQYGPFVHAVTGGPWSFGPRPAYVGAVDQARPGDVAASTRSLVVRYLEGFGPASMQDIAQFSTIIRPPVQAALASLGDALVRYDGPNGELLYDVPGGPLPPEDVPAPPRLLPMWDSTLLAYADRSRVIPPAYRSHVMRKNGDVLPTILLDGQVAGVWRPTDLGIEVTALQALDDDAWAGLETEARSLRAFLAGREPSVFQGRYAHWWSEMPTDGVEVHILGG
ncbi:MAG: winged helix DNA-binding domain-containing protein [Chloroflexi bacterium]|nr:winged helix DNA-binding domain-containing protein [Chloroflexota bacterium]